jgi:hypothetical protein
MHTTTLLPALLLALSTLALSSPLVPRDDPPPTAQCVIDLTQTRGPQGDITKESATVKRQGGSKAIDIVYDKVEHDGHDDFDLWGKLAVVLQVRHQDNDGIATVINYGSQIGLPINWFNWDTFEKDQRMGDVVFDCP